MKNAEVNFFCDHQAGASSMWASCCGLMNEVMGTGAVRGQQPVFGASAGPFRFAPSAGYSTYPPTSSGSTGLVCKACGQAFSVFRRKVGIWIFCMMYDASWSLVLWTIENENVHMWILDKYCGRNNKYPIHLAVHPVFGMKYGLCKDFKGCAIWYWFDISLIVLL